MVVRRPNAAAIANSLARSPSAEPSPALPHKSLWISDLACFRQSNTYGECSEKSADRDLDSCRSEREEDNVLYECSDCV